MVAADGHGAVGGVAQRPAALDSRKWVKAGHGGLHETGGRASTRVHGAAVCNSIANGAVHPDGLFRASVLPAAMDVEGIGAGLLWAISSCNEFGEPTRC